MHSTSSETWPEWRRRSSAGSFPPGTSAVRFGPVPPGRYWPGGSAADASDPAAAADGLWAVMVVVAAAAAVVAAGVDQLHRCRHCRASVVGSVAVATGLCAVRRTMPAEDPCATVAMDPEQRRCG